jgi:hypothetical protein
MPEAKTKVIDGDSYEISQPYEPGHTINEIEARVLNQTRAENIGNNVRAKLKEIKETSEKENWGEKKLSNALLKAVAEVDEGYEFTAAQARASQKLDPVEKEAQKKARALLKDKLAETGRKLTVPPEGVTEADWAEKIAAETDRIAALPQVMEAARQDVEARQNRADEMKNAMGDVSL